MQLRNWGTQTGLPLKKEQIFKHQQPWKSSKVLHLRTILFQWQFLKSRPPSRHIFFNIGEQLWCSGLERAKGLWGIIKTNYLEQILRLCAEVKHKKDLKYNAKNRGMFQLGTNTNIIFQTPNGKQQKVACQHATELHYR